MIPVAAIERVIDDLETRVEKMMTFCDEPRGNVAINAYLYAIQELQKVLSDYGKSES